MWKLFVTNYDSILSAGFSFCMSEWYFDHILNDKKCVFRFLLVQTPLWMQLQDTYHKHVRKRKYSHVDNFVVIICTWGGRSDHLKWNQWLQSCQRDYLPFGFSVCKHGVVLTAHEFDDVFINSHCFITIPFLRNWETVYKSNMTFDSFFDISLLVLGLFILCLLVLTSNTMVTKLWFRPNYVHALSHPLFGFSGSLHK